MHFTINEWVILALVFVLGWLLGLASRSDKRWRRQYEEERAAHEALRRDHDALRRDHDVRQREHDTRIAATDARTAELERPATPSVASTASAAAVLPAHRDDLTRIDGIGAHDEGRLNDAGLYSFRDVAALERDQAADLENRLGFTTGRIDSQRWREQAEMLAHGRTTIAPLGTTSDRS